jgi:hypothetical protein
VNKDTHQIGYISLFTDEVCIKPMQYVPTDNDNPVATKKPFWKNQWLDQRRQDPNAARKKVQTIATIANAWMRITAPLGLFHRSDSW